MLTFMMGKQNGYDLLLKMMTYYKNKILFRIKSVLISKKSLIASLSIIKTF